MRLVGKLQDRQLTQEFSFFLTAKQILNQVEPQPQATDATDTEYAIWIIDEDDFETAVSDFEELLQNPKDPKFHGHQREAHRLEEEKIEEQRKFVEADRKIAPEQYRRVKPRFGVLTLLLVLVSAILYIWAGLEQAATTKDGSPAQRFEITPIYQTLMFDDPVGMRYYIQLVTEFTEEQIENRDQLPPRGRILLKKTEEHPFWRGFYMEILAYFHDDVFTRTTDTPLFEKIGQGEVWRLFTPALLHAGIMHLVFNVLALLFLGNQVEARLGFWRYIILVLITGITANVGQYLMTGPNFLGLSGICYGLFGFIWMRQRRAPWEGYLLNRGIITFVFLLLFLLLAVQLISFFLELAGEEGFAPNIANTAHFVGLAVGILCGLFNRFAGQKVPAH